MKIFEVWNNAAIGKQLWALSFKNERLWVRWVNAYYTKRSSIFDFQLPLDSTWMVKKIVGFRVYIEQYRGWNSMLVKDKYSIGLAYRKLLPHNVKVP